MPAVLIIGAASDMAVAIARKFASKGYSIMLAARNSQRLETLTSDISIRYNVECSLHELDILNYPSHVEFVEQLDLLPEVVISVVGYLGDNETAINNWPEASRIIETNYTGPVSLFNAFASRFEKAKKGVLVGVSSVAGNRGRQSNFMYGSAKAGFTAYLSGLRNRLYHHGVHVLTVKPGFVYTRMTENIKLPPMLTAKPEEVAESIYRATVNKSNIIYTKWFWRWIMLVITSIPEAIFKKLKL